MGDFFRTGMIAVADLRQDGMAAWSQERLKILVKMRASWWAHALSTLPGTLSYWTSTVPGVRYWDLLADIVGRCSEWSGGTSWGWEQGWSTVLLLWYFKEAIYLLCLWENSGFLFSQYKLCRLWCPHIPCVAARQVGLNASFMVCLGFFDSPSQIGSSSPVQSSVQGSSLISSSSLNHI